MSMSASPLETRFSALSQIVRHRVLPVPGRVVVHVGDRVEATDIVAEAPIEGPPHSIDLAEALQVSVRSVSDHLKVTVGQVVSEGDTLASSGPLWLGKIGDLASEISPEVCDRFLRRRVRAPFRGTVQGIVGGVVFLRREPQVLLLRAYLPGRVCERYPHRGAAISTAGCLVRGIWGSGGEGQGLLATVVAGPGETITWQRIGINHRGAIVMGGIIEDRRVLLRAARFGLAGLIAGSISPRLEPVCEKLRLPIVISEGMGHIPIAEPIFELLRSYNGLRAVISGSDRDGHSGPEVIVPLPVEAEATQQPVARALEVGARVRLTRPPYLGAVGQVLSLPAAPQETAVGARTGGAEVRLSDGRTVFVPYSNLERLD